MAVTPDDSESFEVVMEAAVSLVLQYLGTGRALSRTAPFHRRLVATIPSALYVHGVIVVLGSEAKHEYSDDEYSMAMEVHKT